VLAGVALLALRLWLPHWLMQTLEREIGASLGREVHVEALDLSFWPTRVRVSDLTIGGPPGSETQREPLLALQRLELAVDPWALLRDEIHVRRTSMAGLSMRLERNADGVLEPWVLAPADLESEPGEASEPAWPVFLEDLVLEGTDVRIIRHGEASRREIDFHLDALTLSEITFRDERIDLGDLAFRGPRLEVQRSFATGGSPPTTVSSSPVPATPAAESALAPPRIEALAVEDAEFTLLWEDGEPLTATLRFAAREVSTDGRFPVELGLEVEGAELSLAGEAAITPLAFEGTLEWSGLRLPRLVEASGVAFDGAVDGGRTDGRLDVALALGGPNVEAKVTLSGEARVEALAAVAGEVSVTAEAIELGIARVHVPLALEAGAPEIHLSRVKLQQPVVEAQRAGATEGEAPPEAEVEAPPEIRIDEFGVEAGTLTFVDRSVRKRFQTRWRELELSGRGLRWPERDVEWLQLRAKGPGGATLQVEGGLKGGEGELTSTLDRLALAHLDPYAEAFTGLALDGGRLRLRSKLALGPTTRSESVLTLQQAELSEREDGWFESTVGMPLDVALALLRDLEGNITLPIAAEIGPEEARVGLFAIVAATLKHALVGALTSPLKLIGGIASVAGEALTGGALAPLEMIPGSDAVTPESRSRIESLASTLQEKPGLQLVLRGGTDAGDDATLARRMVLERAKEGELPEGSRLGFFERRRVRRALAEVPANAEPVGPDAESEAALAALADAVEVPATRRAELSRSRAVEVRRVLLDEYGVSADAVVVDDATGDLAGVVLELAPRTREVDPS
jgi:hypothetical protein